ncbi:MAG: chemotaxis protein CheX [Gammaproteobacteria bacterium]|nr:chemotaxis protein CheX [Gammaproteobacteria bacterium]
MADMTDSEIKVFIDAVTHYFAQLTREPATIRAAYLANGGLIPHFDYTGLITVSGRYRGCVYFSTSGEALNALLVEFSEPDRNEANLLDAVGEIANTIAGNARKHFGRDLEISAPVTFRGAPEQLKSAVSARPFAIQLAWSKHDAAVVVDLALTG